MMNDGTKTRIHIMPCGGELRLDRPRSQGPLTSAELQFCRENNLPLAFDPLQTGWVPAAVHDDLATNELIDHAHPRKAHFHPNVCLHLHMRAWAGSDVPEYVALLDDPAIWIHMTEEYPNPLTPEIAAALIEVSNASNHHQVHAVLKDDLPVGQVRLLFHEDAPEEAEISYWFGRAHWGQGLASAAVKCFARQCLAENPGLTALIARVRNDNAASLRVLQKAGFAISGPDHIDGWTLLRRPR